MTGAPRRILALAAGAALASGCTARSGPSLVEPKPAASAGFEHAEEKHLRGVRMLTNGGENAEAYWDQDGRRLIFQSTRGDLGCDQIFVMNADGSDPKLVSTGKGRTTCSYLFPGRGGILFSSTHLASAACPAKPDYSQGYVWPLDANFEIFTARDDGTGLRRLTDSPGYDAEATVSRDGTRIVFTSVRDGDPELYSMASDGTDVRRLTRSPGYDGGAFFSADGRRLVYRGRHPEGDELAEFDRLLGLGLVKPTAMELRVMNADGSGDRQLGAFGGANFAPFWHPDGRRIIFASNMSNPRGRNFDLYIVNDDGSGLERITTDESFDGFPMFDPGAKRLVFASNRNGAHPGDTNIFVADWVD